MIVVGEALVDLVEEDDGRFDPRLGGAARNVALALARLGNPVQWCWGLGDDTFGTRFREEFSREGVGLELAVDTGVPTPLALVSVGDGGQPSYSFHLTGTAATRVGDDDLARVPDDRPVHVSLGAVTLATDDVGPVLRRFLAARRDAPGLTTLDPNVRPAFLGDPRDQRRLLTSVAGSCGVVRCSDEDLDLLTGDGDATPDDVVDSWLEAGAGAVVVTRGAEGASVTTRSVRTSAPAPAAAVVDTVGAGDTFGAGMLTALAERGVTSAAALAGLDADDWAGVLALGARAAAVTVSRRGADPPTRAELG